MSMLADSISHYLRIPASCIICKNNHRSPSAVCFRCRPYIPTIENPCSLCANPLPDPFFPLCGECIKQKPVYNNAFIHYAYEEPLKSLIHQFKYQQKLFLADFLSELILDGLISMPSRPDCIVPVPMHSKKLRQRGYNQTVLLARRLSKKLRIPCKINLCKKIKPGHQQAGLSRSLRKSNQKGIYESRPSKYKKILLVDDILTTGSTMNEVSRSLLHQGVEEIYVSCCARTISGVHQHSGGYYQPPV